MKELMPTLWFLVPLIYHRTGTAFEIFDVDKIGQNAGNHKKAEEI